MRRHNPAANEVRLSKCGIAESRIANVNCGGRHAKFEPLAFGLEKFDGINTMLTAMDATRRLARRSSPQSSSMEFEPDGRTGGTWGTGRKDRKMTACNFLSSILLFQSTRQDHFTRLGKTMKNATQFISMGMCLLFVSVTNAESPYPPSRVLKSVTFDFATHERRAPGSDNWAITWGEDDHQYAAWGDGGGFGGTNGDGRVSLGVARIEGPSDKYQGVNVWGGKNAENPARFGGKSYGLLSVGGAMHMWVGPGSDTTSYREARLYKSTDHGANWSKADWAFTKADRLIMPTFCQFGRDYAGARDDYIYAYAIRLQGNPSKLSVHKPGQIDLMRVPKEKLMERASYEFFVGLDNSSQPQWTKEIAARRPVFEDSSGVGWCFSVSYNAGLKRYLLCTEHDASFKGNLGIFDAAQPWGPWTTAGYYQNWGKFGSTFFWNFSNKWLSPDGKSFTLIFTGTGANDSWNIVRGEFSLAQRHESVPIP